MRLTPVLLAAGLAVGCGDSADSAEVGPDAAVQGGAGGERSEGNAGRGGSVSQASASAGKSGGAATRKVDIRFRAVVAGSDFSCRERYESMGATKVAARAGDFRFYVQDVKLIDRSGKAVAVELDTRAPWQIPQVGLIDFEDGQGSCHGTPETNLHITGTVPAGEYQGLVFTNGVPEELNHREQSTQPAPLTVTDLYWAWLSGYRFFVAELRQDVANEGAEDAGAALPGMGLLHIGSTACRRDMGCTKPNRNEIRLESFDPDVDVVVADLAAVFGATDLSKDLQCHSSDAYCAPMFERMGVSFETGQSKADSQQVYRVEKAQGGK